MAKSRERVVLASDRTGYMLGSEYVEGFEHRTDLSEAAQIRFARWAFQLQPDRLTEEQRALLDAQPPRQISAQRKVGLRQDRILASPLVRAVWGTLGETEKELVLNPDLKLGSGNRYPLSTGDLSDLTGLSVRRIQYGTKRGLLPCWTDERGHRRFEAAGAILAFSLADTEQAERQHLVGVLNAKEPFVEMRKAIGRISLYALSAQPNAPEDELRATKEQLRTLAEAIEQAQG